MTIVVKYSCNLCALRRIPLEVPARASEDVRDWMRTVAHAIGADHARRSPRCSAETISEIMIPTPAGAKRIGDPTLN